MRVLGLALAGGRVVTVSLAAHRGRTWRDLRQMRFPASSRWLWLGLASGSRTLEPVERGMGSAALCAEPLLRGLGPLCGWARPLWRMAL
jgi:hypothetical protein